MEDIKASLFCNSSINVCKATGINYVYFVFLNKKSRHFSAYVDYSCLKIQNTVRRHLLIY